MIDFTNVKTIFISGIGGIGVSGLAQILQTKEITIIGSDLQPNHITQILQSKGITIYFKQEKQNISDNIDIHIYSPAVPLTNPERQAVEQKNIPSYSYPEFLGLFSNHMNTVGISGTHGKTTTTAMIGHIFEEAGKSPNVLVGSIVPKWGTNILLGESDIFITESCEHQAHMTLLSPQNAVITNIESDHLDFYSGIDEIKAAFMKFIFSTKQHIIMNADDLQSEKLYSEMPQSEQNRIITFGLNNPAHFTAQNIQIKNGVQQFDIFHNEIYVSNCTISLPGKYSIYNSLAAISLAYLYGIDIAKSTKHLSTFIGTWRRFEKLGTYQGVPVISDYAHHPTAIMQTIQATQEFYPEKEVLVVFQPHQHNRTKKLFNDFAISFDSAKITILCEIFDVAGREEKNDRNISSLDLTKTLSLKNKQSFYAKDFEQAKKLIDKHLQKNSVILIMGAGDIYQLAENLTK